MQNDLFAKRETTRLRVARHRASKAAVAAAPISQATAQQAIRIGGGDLGGQKYGEEAAAIIADWSSKKLVIPTGPAQGSPYILEAWEIEWLAGALGKEIDEAGLSIARKNNKTGLVSVAALANTVGPLTSREWNGVCVSVDAQLAVELRNAMEKTAKSSQLRGWELQKTPYPGSFKGRLGAAVQFLAADRTSGHAIGADLALIDEAGLLVEDKHRELWNSISGSLASRAGRLWALSIQSTGEMFAELEAKKAEPNVYWRRWQGQENCALDDEKAWAAANPGLGTIKSWRYLRARARDAQLNPANERDFRVQHLNQSLTFGRETPVSLSHWVQCKNQPTPERTGPCIAAIDLGGSTSMTAAALLWPEVGRLEVYAALPGLPTLDIRSKADSVGQRYEKWAKDGLLWIDEGHRVTSVPAFLSRLRGLLKDERVIALGCDRARKAELDQALSEAGWRPSIQLRGSPGTKNDLAVHDLRAFQRAVASGELRPVGAEILEWAIGESHVKHVGETPMLTKSRNKARIDTLQATLIVCGLAASYKPQKGGYGGTSRRETSREQAQ